MLRLSDRLSNTGGVADPDAFTADQPVATFGAGRLRGS